MVATAFVAPSPNTVVDSLVLPYRWDTTTLQYGFNRQDIDGNGLNDFDEGSWRPFYKSIFDNISTFANLTFTEGSYETATLAERLVPGGGGQSNVPSPGLQQAGTEVGIAGTVAGASDIVKLGRFSDVWLHEIGHSLGLNHPFDENKLDDGVSAGNFGAHYLNSLLYTVMSYSPVVWGEDNPWTAAYDAGQTFLAAFPGSYMAFDIAALQYMYGAVANATGNTTYRFSDDQLANKGYTTIWDTGGTDTIEYTGTSRALINLQAATLTKEIGGGGFLSTSETLTGGYLIANGVVIENATGGSNDDILIGNVADNTLTGNAGNDRLDGGAGRDRMVGGLGDDVYVVDNTGDTVIELAGQGIDTIETSVSLSLRANVENLVLTGTANIVGIGNTLDNVLTGNAGNNYLSGDAGNDRIDGGAGRDSIIGGAGQDVLTGGSGNDVFVFAPGHTGATMATADRITDFAAGDAIDLRQIDAIAGGGDDAFRFLGTAAFDGRAGALAVSYVGGNTYVAGDTNGDRVADFMIRLDGAQTLAASSFML